MEPAKVGLDDFLVAKGPEAFRVLLDAAANPQRPASVIGPQPSPNGAEHTQGGDPASDSESEPVPPQVLSRPRIEIGAGVADLAIVTPEAIRALVARNDPPRLFRHGGPARIERDDDGAQIVRGLTRQRMQHELARAAHWYRIKKVGKNEVVVDALPPRAVTEDVLATPELPLPI